jgi:CheY-like chemotaxis protein
MLKGIIICEDQQLSHGLSRVLGTTEKVLIKRNLTEYPSSSELLRVLRTQAPDVIFLSFEAPGKAHELLDALEAEGSRAHVVGVSRQVDMNLLQEMMRAGARECLSEPFERQTFMETLQRLKAKPDTRHVAPARVFSFLPSKAGVGTSTVALNVSAALARQPNTRVLLSDFDLSSGMLDFMLKLGKEHSIIDALDRAGDGDLDEDLWSALVGKVDKLDVLHAGGRQPSAAIDGPQISKADRLRGRSL